MKTLFATLLLTLSANALSYEPINAQCMSQCQLNGLPYGTCLARCN